MEFLKDLVGFIASGRRLWLMPVIVILMMIGVLIVLSGGSALAPFIYTLF